MTSIIADMTITGDFVRRTTNVDYRLDTPSAGAFLGQFVELPNRHLRRDLLHERVFRNDARDRWSARCCESRRLSIGR